MKVIFGVTSEQSCILRAFSSKQRAEAFITKYDLYHDDDCCLIVKEYGITGKFVPPCGKLKLVNVFCAYDRTPNVNASCKNNTNRIFIDAHAAIEAFNSLVSYNNPIMNVIELDDDSAPTFAVYQLDFQEVSLEKLFGFEPNEEDTDDEYRYEIGYDFVNSGTHKFITKTLGLNAYLEVTFKEGETLDEYKARAEKELKALLADEEKKTAYMQSLERKYFKPADAE